MSFFQCSLMLRRLSIMTPQTANYGSNAGIRNRLKIYRQGNPELKNTKLTEEDLDDAEMDIMNSEILRDDYKKEYDKISKKIDLKRIERQYFDKKTTPNFLLWSEKKQIRELHQSSPDEWTYEKLSESFPATPGVIKKIVKAQWRTKEVDVRKHDARVAANWKALQENKLNIPLHVRDHITQFSARNISQGRPEGVSGVTILEDHSPTTYTTKSTKFIDIIRNYNTKNENKPPPESSESRSEAVFPSKPGETYVLQSDRNTHGKMAQYTLEQMRQMGEIDNALDSSEWKDSESVETGIVNPVDPFSIPRQASMEHSNSIAEEPEAIKMKIRIPQDKWKKGAVFRVNNCFYADDGEFLYKI